MSVRHIAYMAFACATVVVATLLAIGAEAAEPTSFKFIEQDGGVWVMEGNARVLRYQRDTKSLNGKFPRANYVHPLLNFDGDELTEDFPADHPHHRGIFWGWHQVWIGQRQVADPWAIVNASWNVQSVRTEESADAAVLRIAVQWLSPLWLDAQGQKKPFILEHTTIRVHRAETDHRAVDFEIRLLALESDMRLGGSNDDKGYGGFSPRLRLPLDVHFVSERGALEPTLTPLDAGAWVDVSATYGPVGKLSGTAILSHPSLPTFPPQWILRRQGSMQNAVFPGANPVPLSSETPLVLRYRLVVHRGLASVEQVNAWQREYALSK